MRVLLMKKDWAIAKGFSCNRKKRRRQHRSIARSLCDGSGLNLYFASLGKDCKKEAYWHLQQARLL